MHTHSYLPLRIYHIMKNVHTYILIHIYHVINFFTSYVFPWALILIIIFMIIMITSSSVSSVSWGRRDLGWIHRCTNVLCMGTCCAAGSTYIASVHVCVCVFVCLFFFSYCLQENWSLGQFLINTYSSIHTSISSFLTFCIMTK